MRVLLAAALICCGCEKAPETGEVGVQQSALSAAVKVATLDGGRPALFGQLVGIEQGVVQLAEEPWFHPLDGGPSVLLGDLTPGNRGSFLATITAAGEGQQAYFVAPSINPGPRVDALWATDGTFENTAMLFDGGQASLVGPAPLGMVVRVPSRAGVEALVAVRGLATTPKFFEADAGFTAADFQATQGGVVFVVDGALFSTDGGRSDRLSSDVSSALVPFGGKVWFAGREGAALALFSSDGTVVGTSRTPTPLVGVSALRPTASALAVVADAPGSQRAVYFTDGTDAGTRVVSPALPTVELVATTDTHAFFSADGGMGNALWSADGAGAAEQVSPFTVRSPTATQHFTLATQTRLYFTDPQGLPWVSDGTPAGTVQLSTTATAASGFAALDATRVLFFATVAAGDELWISGGTPADTRRLAQFYRGQGASIPAGTRILVHGGVGWFHCLTQSAGGAVCRTDGTTAGTVPVPVRGRLNAGAFLARANQSLLIGMSPNIAAWNPQSGVATLPVRNNVTPQQDPNGGAWLIDTIGSDARIWHSDGTAAGTVNVGSVPGRPLMLHATREAAFVGVGFSVLDAVYAWRPDAGALPLVPTSQGIPQLFATWGDELAWAATTDAGMVIFASNGVNTRVAVNPTPSDTTDVVRNLTEFEGNLYFTLSGSTGSSLMRALPDAGAEQLVANSSQWFRAGTQLYVLGLNSFGRWNPVTSSVDPLATYAPAQSLEPKAVGDGLVVAVQLFTRPLQTEVWATDGTPAGTRRLEGVFEGGNAPTVLHVAGSTSDDIFFPSWTRERGLEPGVLVSGASAVTPLPELCPGPCSSLTFGAEPVIIDSTLYFLGEDQEPNTVTLFSSDLNVPSPAGGGGGGGAGAGGGTGTGGGSAGGSSGGAGGGTSGMGGGSDSGGGGGGDATPSGCTCSTATGWAWGLVIFLRSRRRRDERH